MEINWNFVNNLKDFEKVKKNIVTIFKNFLKKISKYQGNFIKIWQYKFYENIFNNLWNKLLKKFCEDFGNFFWRCRRNSKEIS